MKTLLSLLAIMNTSSVGTTVVNDVINVDNIENFAQEPHEILIEEPLYYIEAKNNVGDWRSYSVKSNLGNINPSDFNTIIFNGPSHISVEKSGEDLGDFKAFDNISPNSYKNKLINKKITSWDELISSNAVELSHLEFGTPKSKLIVDINLTYTYYQEKDGSWTFEMWIRMEMEKIWGQHARVELYTPKTITLMEL
ncbi:hypothetical protein [Spiroplasma endosymbiont of Othius punctulatus]|uniref:hypothetical protein n=1 Tax=Spiroplasma endosymbiont of Othius punctulatus TaxID=3066289 RepID=UPI0030CC80C2